MKLVLTLAAIVSITSLITTSASAAKADGPKAKLFAKYDKNSNGSIDGEEKDALRKDFEADKKDELKRFDKNKDGKIDDKEIAAIKPPEGKKKGEKTEKAKKTEGSEKSEKSEKSESGEKGEKKSDK